MPSWSQQSVRDFPVNGLLPKEETQSAAFVRAHPEYDGRGVTIAILDTGVDPGAPGLEVTSDGRPKVIELIDCTGSGDVPCTTVVEATSDENGKTTVTGLSGRKLTLGKWNNPTGKYRLGVKKSAELFPKGLVDRLEKERKRKFEVEHHQLVTQAQKEASEFDKANPSPNEEQQLVKADHKARFETLRDLWKSYEDPGILIDCVVFHDGTKWRAAIDINESGDLTNAQLLTNFADERQFVRFGDDSMLNFSVNIHDEGETLSIVTVAGSHGTHVAAIAAANYPDDPRLNGVAPGAQIVSLKIGDTRLGSMETGSGLVRAAIELVRLKIDVANISYGEAAANPNYGRFIELLRDEVVNKSGCVVLSSAGNAGPALSTVGAPGGTSSGVIGVGAYVTRGMMDAEYALLESVTERPYTWSSRGPTLDGDVGVDIFAPGAAITSVPQYTIQNSQLMNGTSMSSPNCCGCVALLISGLKAEQIPYNPYRIKAAIVNTGKDISDPMNVPFIQVENAWQHLSEFRDGRTNFDVHYEVTLPEKYKYRGIYLRDLDETSELQTIQVHAQPVFPNALAPSQNALKLEMEARLALVPTQRWISAPDYLHLNNGGRGFNVQVDPSNLPPGLHFGEIVAYETARKSGGPLFKVPVTVCKPQPVDLNSRDCYVKWDGVRFEPGAIERRFISVPAGANFAELIVRSENRQAPARFIVHMMQLQPQTRYVKFEKEYAFSLTSPGSGDRSEASTYQKTFPVLPNVTLEVCLAQFWSSPGTTSVSIELKFHGILCSVSGSTSGGLGASSGTGGDLVYLNSGNHGFARVDVATPLRKEEVAPTVSLDTLRRFIRPTDSQMSPLKSRDVLPDSRQLHQLVLTYSVKITEAGAGVNVTPRVPRFNEVLYDASVESFVLIVFDANKRSVSYQDIYPKAVKLADGTYTIKVQIQAASVDILDKMTSAPLVLDVALAKPLNLTAYKSIGDIATGAAGDDAKFKKKILRRGDRAVFWIGGELSGAQPKDAKQGDLLVGKMEVVGGGKKVEGCLYPVAWIVPPPEANKEESEGTGPKEPPKDDTVLLKEATRDLEISWLKKMAKEENKTALLKRLESEYADHLPLYQAKLDSLAEKAEKAEKADGRVSRELAKEIIDTADKILSLVDLKELAVYLGTKHDLVTGGEKEKNRKKEMDRQKEAIIAAYGWNGRALKATIENAEVGKSAAATLAPAPTADMALFDSTLSELAKWIADPPTTDGKYLLLWAWQQRRRGLHATALKALNKFVGEVKNVGAEGEVWKKAVDMKREVLAEIGWEVWSRYEERWRVVKAPKEYAPF
ncbi:tripeptidyl-peptidase II Tpp2 [Borealophlyctis nickersoniae]|nr:tripeptidyl-peptidase II Tpp2 [Borealophlyctis nickersoniae]